MKTALPMPAALLLAALMLSACQGAPDGAAGDPERYKKSHDRYMDSHEPKTGGPG
jgi:hypothetical protein